MSEHGADEGTDEVGGAPIDDERAPGSADPGGAGAGGEGALGRTPRLDPVVATHPPVTRLRRRRLLRRPAFKIGDLEVTAGRAAIGDIPISRLVTGNQISLPINVVHGRHDGPVVWLSAAVHGDEIGGVEIIRRTLAGLDASTLAGTIVAVPIVNVHGFLNGDRYLPDRRDLNRSFPGSPNGSLAARIANLFITQIVERCDVGIDLHTGSDHRTNLPQIRADLDDPRTRDLAIAFGAPVMMHAKLRDGSMRAAATATGSTVLLYEGGEAWRFDKAAIEAGVAGVGRVLGRLGMTTPIDEAIGLDGSFAAPMPAESRGSGWVRVRRSGIVLLDVELGQLVERGDVIATVRDSVGRRLSSTRANRSGMVVGHTQQPLVNQGDAIVHIAELVERADAATADVGAPLGDVIDDGATGEPADDRANDPATDDLAIDDPAVTDDAAVVHGGGGAGPPAAPPPAPDPDRPDTRSTETTS